MVLGSANSQDVMAFRKEQFGLWSPAEHGVMLESEWQKTVIELAHTFHWLVAHFLPAETTRGWRTPAGADGAGFPDLVLVRERVIWAELKQIGKKPSERQQMWLDALEKAGQEVYVWRESDYDDVVAILR